MTSHVHLPITPRLADAVPRLIIALGRRYVQYINSTYRRTGTLWDSRYQSSLVQAETYLLTSDEYGRRRSQRRELTCRFKTYCTLALQCRRG